MHRRGRGRLEGYGDLSVRSRAVHGNWGSRLEGYIGGMRNGGTAIAGFWLMHRSRRQARAG